MKFFSAVDMYDPEETSLDISYMKLSASVGRTSAHQFLVISCFLAKSVNELKIPPNELRTARLTRRGSLAKQ
jgi:hypothetical protein